MGTCTDRIEDYSASSVFYTWRTSNFTTTQSPKGREYTYSRSSKYHLEKVYNSTTTIYDLDRVQRPYGGRAAQGACRICDTANYI